MEEKVVKMIIYTILSVNDDEKKTITDCIEFTKLLTWSIEDNKTRTDEMFNIFPSTHPVSALYKELMENNTEDIIKLLESCQKKFENSNVKNDCLKYFTDDAEVEALAKEILN